MPVPALGQLSLPPEKFTWGPLSASKMEREDSFTQNAILHFMHMRFLMNEPDGYVLTQNAIASDFASTHPSLKSTLVFITFSYVIYLRQ